MKSNNNRNNARALIAQKLIEIKNGEHAVKYFKIKRQKNENKKNKIEK